MTSPSDARRVIYIAGPYTADPAHYTRQCQLMAAVYIAAGHTVICPHVTSTGIEGLVTEPRWREHGIELLTLCDTIQLHPEWSRSEGARYELAVALAIDLDVWGLSVAESERLGDLSRFAGAKLETIIEEVETCRG